MENRGFPFLSGLPDIQMTRLQVHKQINTSNKPNKSAGFTNM